MRSIVDCNFLLFILIFMQIIGKPVSWIMIAPSVTPRKSNIGSNNPAMRLYKFETDTGQVSLHVLDHSKAFSLSLVEKFYFKYSK